MTLALHLSYLLYFCMERYVKMGTSCTNKDIYIFHAEYGMMCRNEI